jgi:hypothetical protein
MRMSLEARLLWGFGTFSTLLASLGCATTGLGWVNEPESGVDLNPPPSGSASEMPVSKPVYPEPAAETVAPPQRSSHHRLDHTITLGEVTVLDSRPEPAPPSRDATVVNIYVSPSAPVPAYAGYGASYAFGAAPFANVPARSIRVNTASPPMRPGLDWPAVPNHGAPFPYRTAPASPWDGDGSRRR